MSTENKENLISERIENLDDNFSPSKWKKVVSTIKIPADEIVLNKVINLISDKNLRIAKVSECILKDPVTTLEILHKANSGEFVNEKNKISAIHTAVVRIGSEELLKACNDLLKSNDTEHSAVNAEIKTLRNLSCRAALIAEILSSHLQKDIVELCQTCALLSYYGQMLACFSLKEKYLELSNIKKRGALNYKLLANFSFDTSKIQIEHFKDKNLPNIVFFAFDKELKCKTTAQSSLRFIVESAMEISEAQEEGKLDKYKFFHRLPSKSSLRLLKINDQNYEYIFSEIEEALGISSGTRDTESKEITKATSTNKNSPELQENNKLTEDAESLKAVPTIIMDRSELVNFYSGSENTLYIEKNADSIEKERSELSPSSDAIIGMMQSICSNAQSAKELIEDIMEVVIEKGPFIRTAVIEIGQGRREAFIYTALGEDFDNLNLNKGIEVKDPLSPLSTVITKVQSFNSKVEGDSLSPFGITSYAISPIKSKSDSQLVLYADCGTERPLPFEARKVFRLTIALLNEALPKLNL